MSNKDHNVFISYNSKEFDRATEIKEILEKNGVKAWMAPQDLPSGSSYIENIPAAIDKADIFVLVLSQKAQESKWVIKELSQAVTMDKYIVPIAIEDCHISSGFGFILTDVQIKSFPKEMPELLEVIKKHLPHGSTEEPENSGLQSYNGFDDDYIYLNFDPTDEAFVEEIVKSGFPDYPFKFDNNTKFNIANFKDLERNVFRSSAVVNFLSSNALRNEEFQNTFFTANDLNKNAFTINIDNCEVPNRYSRKIDTCFSNREELIKALSAFIESNGSRLKVVEGDLSQAQAEAIVTSTNSYLKPNFGVNRAIIDEADSSELLEILESVGYLPRGESIITDAYNLKAKKLIHTVGAVRGKSLGLKDDARILKNAYQGALELAKEYGCRTIALPLFSTGFNGYDPKWVYGIAKGVIKRFLTENPDFEVSLYVLDKSSIGL